ncbi:hypothetical protein HF086_009918 [Spodoptera exigua]|uniref:RRM domain-containing protein n=1 Tax=Spodoptera exigua TaxID=7107 RepID=A0A922S9B1_SPOEX|nr:hypothetical protein HF086_009918 [Spodoptera exigua]
MFYEEEERFLNPDILHVVRRELYAINSNYDVTPYGLKYVPTHTEDGIPIRKLYVSNLPPKTTRSELFGVFAPYGFIKSCWLRMGDKGPNKTPTPTYAFVTYSNPADAHKALQAPGHEKTLRGRNLRISPADSWHQPAEDADGRGRWKPRGQRRNEAHAATTENSVQPLEVSNSEWVSESGDAAEATTSATDAPMDNTEAKEDAKDSDTEPNYTILDVLNRDCLAHIMSYVPIRDLIRSERVSKTWQHMVREYLQGIRMFKTSWWQHVPVMLTTAVLRRIVQRLGAGLARLHIDHHWSALNDRTAHIVGKFCPNLEELKLTDSSLVHLVKSESCIESLTVANNTHVTGLFLTGSNPQKLNSLAFYNCYSLQGTVLCAAIDTLPRLTCLKLDVCPHTMWKIIPMILNKLPLLEELSLSEYISVDSCFSPQCNDAFCDAIGNLTELKSLNLSRNIYVTNTVLKRVAQCCPKLETLNISSCNSRKIFPHPGVSDEGVWALCRGCRALSSLDVSYLAALTDAGLRAAAALPRLQRLTARGMSALSSASLAACLAACPMLQELDVCGCDGVSEEVVRAATRALALRPRALTLRLAGTAASSLDLQQDCPTHKLLTVDVADDRSNPHLRPDFVDTMYEHSSDDSLGDLYENDDFDDFFGPDEDLFLDEDLDDFDGMYHFELHAPDIILL